MLQQEKLQPILAQAGGSGAEGLMNLLPFILIFVIMYFLILRPQQKRMREHQTALKNIRRGDTIIMGGGLIAKVTKVTDDSDEIEAEIATNTKVRVARNMIAEVRVKGEPVAEASKA